MRGVRALLDRRGPGRVAFGLVALQLVLSVLGLWLGWMIVLGIYFGWLLAYNRAWREGAAFVARLQLEGLAAQLAEIDEHELGPPDHPRRREFAAARAHVRSELERLS